MSEEELRRQNNFMEKPESGWLHDDNALTAGDEGIFYSFPVFYAGSIVLQESLRGLDMQEQTDLTRELMAYVAEKARVREAADRQPNEALQKKFKKFLSGQVTVGQVEVSLCVSSTALAIGPPQELAGKAGSLSGFFALHDMKTVSLASGGELRDYDLVAYVAKDSSGLRECHVFDCGNLSDEVLTTIGQAFVLAQTRNQKAVLDALATTVKAAPSAAGGDKKRAIVEGLNKLDSVRRSVKAPSAKALKAAPKQGPKQQKLTPSEMEALRLREGEMSDKNRPSWVCWSQAESVNKISLDELRRQWAEQAQTQEIIEIEEED